jgi:hypothetical protein
MRVRAYIDGRSVLRIDEGEILWVHDDAGAAPGRGGGANLPTVFDDLNYGYDDGNDNVDDGYRWTPKWHSNTKGWESAPGAFGDLSEGGYSEPLALSDLKLRFSALWNEQTFTDVRIFESAGSVTVHDTGTQGSLPQAEIVFDGAADAGASWYDVNIVFVTVVSIAGVPIQPSDVRLSQFRLRSYIDGYSLLRPEETGVAWHHFDTPAGAAPGRYGGTNLPTVFNDLDYGYDDGGDNVNDGYRWTPKWHSNTKGWESEPGDFGTLAEGGYSEPLSYAEMGLEPPFLPDAQTIVDTRLFEGRGTATANGPGIPKNGIAFDDTLHAGAAWYDIHVVIASVVIPPFALRAEIIDKDGEPVPGGYAINWYTGASETPVASGSVVTLPYDLSVGVNNIVFEARLTLGDELCRAYKAPEPQFAVLSNGEFVVRFNLAQIPLSKVVGRVTDGDGLPIPGAAIHISQQFSDRVLTSSDLYSDEDGIYEARLPKVKTAITAAKPGYFDAVIPDALSDASPDAVELRTARLIPDDQKAIFLSPVKRKAAADGKGEISALSSFANVDFALYNVTQDERMPRIRAQYPYLILFDEAPAAGDVIEIIASDRLGRTVAEPLRVTLDANLNAEAEVEFVEKGVLSASARGDNLALIFDASGDCVQNIRFTDVTRSEPLAEGAYTAVFMEDTGYLAKVSHIGKLAKLRLKAGEDFAQRSVAAANGRIAELGEIDLPKMNVEKLFYTKTAFFTANKSEVGAGFVNYRLEYELDDKYAASDETLSIELAEGLALYGDKDTVTLDGLPVAYTFENGILTVKTDRRGGVLRFCATSSGSGEQTAYAFLACVIDGADILQPLGTAEVKAKPLQLNYPKKTGRQQVIVSGYAAPGSSVSVYDNDAKIAKTVSNFSGRWEVAADLHKPYSVSTHQIRAVATNARGDQSKAEEGIIEYNKTYPDISKVTMINLTHAGYDEKNQKATYGENITEIDFLDSSGMMPYYSFDPVAPPVFTFEVEFLNPGAIGDSVSLIVTGANGEKRRVDTSYVESRRAWVGRASFDTANRPAKVGIEFSANPDAISFEMSGEELDAAVQSDMELCENLLAMQPEELDLFSDAVQSILGAMGATVDFEPDAEYADGEFAYGTETIRVRGEAVAKTAYSPLSDSVTEETLLARGFEQLPQSKYFNNAFRRADGSAATYAYLDSRLQVTVEYIDGSESQPLANSDISALGVNDSFHITERINQALAKEKAAQEELQRINESIKAALGNAVGGDWSKMGISYMMEEATRTQRAIAASRSRIVEYAWKIDRMQNMEGRTLACDTTTENLKFFLVQEERHLDRLVVHQNKEMAASAFSFVLTVTGLTGIIPKVSQYLLDIQNIADMLKSLRDLYRNNPVRSELFIRDRNMDYVFKAADAEYVACMEKCLSCDCVYKTKPCPHGCDLYCTCEEEEQSEPVVSILDPSGYVYEAVPSNRLKGVTATAYYKAKEEDISLLWDAGAYSQINPIRTDAAGFYAWDVPEGLWQVKYEMAGYGTAYSAWLPVPPPQLEVNVGLVSKTPPVVTGAYVWEDGVDVTFSKYMKPDTVNAAIAVFDRAGQPVSGRTVAVDLEDGLASAFRFVPDKPFANGEQLTVTVAKRAESYAAVFPEKDFQTAAAVLLRPKEITAEDLAFTFGGHGMLIAQVTPNAAAANRRVFIESNTPSIASAPAEALTDENGRIKVHVVPSLPGTAFFTLRVEGTDLKAHVSADITMPGSGDSGNPHHPDPDTPGSDVPGPNSPESDTPDPGTPNPVLPEPNTPDRNAPVAGRSTGGTASAQTHARDADISGFGSDADAGNAGSAQESVLAGDGATVPETDPRIKDEPTPTSESAGESGAQSGRNAGWIPTFLILAAGAVSTVLLLRYRKRQARG